MRIVRGVSFTSEQWERVQKHAVSRGMPIARFMRFAVMQAVSKEHDRRRIADLLTDLDDDTPPSKTLKAEAAPRPARAPARAARRAPGP